MSYGYGRAADLFVECEALCFDLVVRNLRNFNAIQDEDDNGSRCMAWTDCVYIFYCRVFSGPSTRDVEQADPRFCMYIIRYRYDECRALPIHNSLRGDDDHLDDDGRLSAGVET